MDAETIFRLVADKQIDQQTGESWLSKIGALGGSGGNDAPLPEAPPTNKGSEASKDMGSVSPFKAYEGGGGAGAGETPDRYVNTRAADTGAGGAGPGPGLAGGGGAQNWGGENPYGGAQGAPQAPVESSPQTQQFQPAPLATQPSARMVEPSALKTGAPSLPGGPGGAYGAPSAPPTGGGGPSAPKTPDYLSQYSGQTLANIDEQKRNIENQSAFEAQNAAMQAAQQQQAYETLQAQDEAARALRVEHEQKAEGALAQLNARADELGNQKVPQNWGMPGWQMVMVAIAGAINGNTSVVEKVIERNTQLQQAAYEKKKDSYLAKKSNFGQLMAIYKDEDMAAAGDRVIQIDQTQRKLALMAQSNAPEATKLKADQALTQLGQMRADAEFKFKQLAVQAQMQATKGAGSALPPALKAVYGTNVAQAKADYAQFLKANPDKSWMDFASQAASAGKGTLGKSGGGGARGAGIYNNFVNAEAVEQAAIRLKQMHRDYSLTDSVTHPVEAAQKRAEIEKLQNMIVPAAARMVHGGSATKEEIELEMKGLGGSWDPLGTRQKRLDIIIEEAKKRKESYAKGLQQGFGSATEESDSAEVAP